MSNKSSPFKDINILKRDIENFLNIYRSTFMQEISRTSAYFEVAVFNDLVRYYQNNGYDLSPMNLKTPKRQFVYALSPNAKPNNISYFSAIKLYKNLRNREFEIRHNIRIQSKHDNNIFLTPDYAVIDSNSISSTRVKHYYNAKVDYYYVPSNNVATFAETKHYYPGPELILNFVGLVNEIMPELIMGKPPNKLPKHFGPALFISGVGNLHIQSIKSSLMNRYDINVLLGLFANPTQLYSKKYSFSLVKIGSK